VKALLLIGWMIATAVLLWWPQRPPVFAARWITMPPAMSWDMLDRARKAAARPSYCMWNGPDTPCRVG